MGNPEAAHVKTFTMLLYGYRSSQMTQNVRIIHTRYDIDRELEEVSYV